MLYLAVLLANGSVLQKQAQPLLPDRTETTLLTPSMTVRGSWRLSVEHCRSNSTRSPSAPGGQASTETEWHSRSTLHRRGQNHTTQRQGVHSDVQQSQEELTSKNKDPSHSNSASHKAFHPWWKQHNSLSLGQLVLWSHFWENFHATALTRRPSFIILPPHPNFKSHIKSCQPRS